MAHLRHAAKELGTTPEALNPDAACVSQVPLGLMYLFEIFVELSGTRTSTGFGVNPISYAEMVSWCMLTNVVLEHWEVALIRQVDAAYLEVVANGLSSTKRNSENARRSSNAEHADEHSE